MTYRQTDRHDRFLEELALLKRGQPQKTKTNSKMKTISKIKTTAMMKNLKNEDKPQNGDGYIAYYLKIMLTTPHLDSHSTTKTRNPIKLLNRKYNLT